MKKIISKVLIFCFLLNTLIFAFPSESVKAANTSGSFEQRITQLQKKFPNGKYWNHEGKKKNNPDGYTSRPCTHHGNCSKNGTDYSGSCGCNSFNGVAIQCMGFAEKLGYDLFGTNPRTQWTKSYNLANVKAGDIVRYNNHSIFVTKVSGDTLTYADCNSDWHCKIRWGATIKKSQIKNLLYIQHANNYNDVVKKTDNSKPKKSTLSSVTSAKTGQVKVKWKRDKQVSGYQIVLSTNSKFKSGKKVVKVTKNSTIFKTVKGLKSGKKYYVRVRAYKVVNGKNYYGSYSKVKSVRCK